MAKIENYPNAYKEVYVILNNMNPDDTKAIPKLVINKIKNKMNENYEFKLDLNVNFEKQILLKETKIILAYLFLNYWATDEQRKKIEKKFMQDIINEEQKKRIYKLDNLLENTQNRKSIQKLENKVVVYNKENIIKKIINIIKRIFTKKN